LPEVVCDPMTKLQRGVLLSAGALILLIQLAWISDRGFDGENWAWVIPLVIAAALLFFGFSGRSGPRQSQRVGVPAGPINRFAVEIRNWPADQGIAAMALLRAFLSGDGAKIDELTKDITVGQFERVMAVLKEINAEKAGSTIWTE
jgi:hypothetical protein